MSKTFQAITGMKDLIAPEIGRWQAIEATARAHFAAYGFSEIRTPILEETHLFERGIGTETGVVQKEMYTFLDKGGDSVTLRPEGTASVVRAYLEHHLEKADPVNKLYYIGPMFRYERPQKGRLRQFHQIGAELFGAAHPAADAETIALLDQFVRKLGITQFELQINSLGCQTPDCRPKYLETIRAFFNARKTEFCEQCQKRIETNPLRVLDCKNAKCQELAKDAPVMLDFLCGECKPHFDSVRKGLDDLKVTYVLNPRIVRGLDYYNRTAFELLSNALGSQNAFAGGGRYDGLVQSMGGDNTPGVGFAIGVERLALLLPEAQAAPSKKIYIASMGDAAKAVARQIAFDLRGNEMICELDYEEKSFKAQFRRANKLGATHIVILGDNEIAAKKAAVKDLATGVQQEVELNGLVEFFKLL